MDLPPGVNEWADQPGPDGALMIGAVTRTQVAAVDRAIIGMIRRERTQADPRDELTLDDTEQGRPARFVQDRILERDGENLVWTAGVVGCARLTVAIDHVVKVAAFFVPKPGIE